MTSDDGGGIYHDGRYLADNPDWHDDDAPWKAANIADLLCSYQLPRASIADVGTGTGGVLRALAGLGVGERYVGYDVSPQAHAIAVERTDDERITWRLGDVFSDPPAEPYDVVMANDVFEHVEDYLGFLRLFRPLGRRHVFHIPLDLSVQAVLRARPILANRARLGHLHYFTKDTALATLTDAGYSVIEHRYTAAALDRGENLTAKAKLLRLPRLVGARVAPDLAARVLGGWSLLVLAEPIDAP